MYENRRYLIIPTSILDDINFNEVQETSADTVRKSVDGTKTFVKYEVQIVEQDYDTQVVDAETNESITVTTTAGVYGRPSFYSDEYLELTHSEILQLLSTDEWTDKTIITE